MTNGAKKPFNPPTLWEINHATEISDHFPGAPYLRGAGFRTYQQVFAMSPRELDDVARAVGAEAARHIAALRPPGRA